MILEVTMIETVTVTATKAVTVVVTDLCKQRARLLRSLERHRPRVVQHVTRLDQVRRHRQRRHQRREERLLECGGRHHGQRL